MTTKNARKSKIKPKSEEIEDPNAKWGHALPLEETRLWDDKKAELEFMKDLFFERLPIGKDTQAIEAEFNRLQQAIDNKENINCDEFPDYDTVDVDGSVKDPPKDFHYFSASVLKQQAERGRIDTAGYPLEAIDEFSAKSENVDTSSDRSLRDSAQGDAEEYGNMESDTQCIYGDPLSDTDSDD